MRPNGLRISGERGGEADERVRCMRVLGLRPLRWVELVITDVASNASNERIAIRIQEGHRDADRYCRPQTPPARVHEPTLRIENAEADHGDADEDRCRNHSVRKPMSPAREVSIVNSHAAIS